MKQQQQKGRSHGNWRHTSSPGDITGKFLKHLGFLSATSLTNDIDRGVLEPETEGAHMLQSEEVQKW